MQGGSLAANEARGNRLECPRAGAWLERQEYNGVTGRLMTAHMRSSALGSLGSGLLDARTMGVFRSEAILLDKV